MNTRAYTGHQYGSYIVHEYNGMPQPTYDEQVVSLASSGWIWKQTVLRFSWPFSLFIPKTYCIEQDPYVWYWLTLLPCTSVFPVCFWLWRDFNLENHSKGSDFRTEILKKMGALNVFWKGNAGIDVFPNTVPKLTARTFHFLCGTHCNFFSYFFYKNNPDGQQPIKEPSLKYHPFPLLIVSSLIRDHNVFLVGVFSVCFLP